MATSLRVTPNSTSGASVAVWDYFLGAPYNKKNREQRIRISTYQKSCIVKYTVSEVEIILYSLFPFIVRSFLQYFKYWYFMELHTNINENASNLKIFNEIYEFPRRELKMHETLLNSVNRICVQFSEWTDMAESTARD